VLYENPQQRNSDVEEGSRKAPTLPGTQKIHSTKTEVLTKVFPEINTYNSELTLNSNTKSMKWETLCSSYIFLI
jgi:hypothetical protein